MEELLAYILLLPYEIVPESEYLERLHTLFLAHPENEDFLNLEEKTDIKNAIIYVRSHINYFNYNRKYFGKILMEKLKAYYKQCSNIKKFAETMYCLWEDLPGYLQNEEPFFTLSYADDPLCWGDEEQSKNIYEYMLNYYEDESR